VDSERSNHENLAEVSGRVHGVRVHGVLPAAFGAHLLPCTDGQRELRTGLEVTYREATEVPSGEELWVAEPQGPIFRGRLALFRPGEGVGLAVDAEGRGVFHVTSRAIAIDWVAGGTGAAHYFFSHALPLWLEIGGVPVLHASAVAFGDRAVAFLGRSGVGKSTLCAELAQAGCGFVADDGLALREGVQGDWRCFHGPPLLRLWPSALGQRLGIAFGELTRVHDTLGKRHLRPPELVSVAPEGLELARDYVLDRQIETACRVSISRYRPRQSLVRLIEHSVAGAPASALGLARRRLELLARVVERVPVCRLGFPSADDSSSRVREAILGDLA